MKLLETYTVGDFLKKEFPVISTIVEDIISKDELILLTAPAKAGKSMLALDLAISVTKGRLFLKRYATHKTNVLLLQTEIAEVHFQKRIKDSGYVFNETDSSLILSSARIRLDVYEDLEILKNTLLFHDCGLLILDPFYTLHNKDENSSMEIAPVLTRLQKMIREVSCACLLIHHQGKRGESSGGQTGHKARGSSSFADVPDGSLSLSRKGSKTLTLAFEFRNRMTPEPIELITHDGLSFEFASADSNAEEDKGVLIQNKLENFPQGLSSKDIILFFQMTLKQSKSSAEKSIKSAVDRGLLFRKKVGKDFMYFHPLHYSGHGPVNTVPL